MENDKKIPLHVLDLFSGIGGFSYALERLCPEGAFRTIAFCEQDKFCQSVLRKHWPDTPIFDDVRTIPTNGLGKIDVVVGGFPCQPWSVAGEQRGAEDDRDLWPEMARLIGEIQPAFVVGENVAGFVSEPMGLERSLSDLESLGYQVVPFVIPACAVGAPHRRDRVWILGHSDSAYTQRKGFASRVESALCITDTRGKSGNANRNNGQQSSEDVADTHGWRQQGSGELVATINSTKETLGQAVEFRNGCKHGSRSIESRLGRVSDGVPDWMDEPDIPRVKKSFMGQRDRLKALGNAVAPQVVAEIGKAILSAVDE